MLDAGDFGDDVRGALGGFGIDLLLVGFELFPRNIAQCLDGMVEQGIEFGSCFFAAFAACVVGGIGQGMFDVRIDHQEDDIVGQFDRVGFQGAKVGVD